MLKKIQSIGQSYNKKRKIILRRLETFDLKQLIPYVNTSFINTSISTELNLTYDQYVKLLLTKYGAVPGDYYIYDIENKLIRNTNIVKPLKNLYIHHIKENEVGDLCKLERAYEYPDYQKKELLVFCNLYEHILLHMKIFIETYRLGLGIFQYNMLYDLFRNYNKNGLALSDCYKIIIDFLIRVDFDGYCCYKIDTLLENIKKEAND